MSGDPVTQDALRDACALWQSDTAEMLRVLPEKLQRKAELVDRGVRRTALILYGTCALQIAVFLSFLVLFRDPLRRVGAILTLVGLTYLIYQMRRHHVDTTALARATQADPSVIFYRALLQQRRDFHRGIWLWSRLAVFLPGPAVFMYGAARADPAEATVTYVVLAIFLLLGAAAVPLNVLVAAGRIQKKIDELDRIERDG
jgi:hypothetical protein